MLEPLILSPEIFNSTELSNRANRSVISGILKDICKAGAILDFSGGVLLKTIISQIEELENNKTFKIKERLKYLKKRNRIVYLKLKNEVSTVKDVEKVLLDEDLLKSINRFVFSDERYSTDDYKKLPKTHYLDVNDEDWWEKYNQQTISCDMTEESLNHFFRPVLKFAKRINIIDPYFNCYDDSTRNESHLKTFNLILTQIQDSKVDELVLHTSLKSMPKGVNINQYYKDWDKLIMGYDTDIQLDVFIWEELPNRERFHNRYILTNQASFGNPEGWACWLKPQKSYIHLIDFKGNNDETNHLATTFNKARVKILDGVKLISNFE